MAEVLQPTPDLTVIYLSVNRLPEHWVNYQRKVLKEATKGFPVITVTRHVTDWGDVNLLDKEEPSHYNMYVQLLRACELAETPYIATAEDDVLYPREHFTFYRPPLNVIAYDMSRWSLYWWEPIYSVKQRISNCTLIAPRLEYIEALEERIAKMSLDRPELISEVGRYEKNLGVSQRSITQVYSPVPVVQVNHRNSTDPLAKGGRKRMGQLKAYDIPYWGKAEEILKRL